MMPEVEARVAVYRYGGRLFVPTEARTTAGFWIEVEPVRDAPMDPGPLASALRDAVTAGTATVPAPLAPNSRPVMLDHVAARSYSEFARKARVWQAVFSASATRVEQFKELPEGGWVPDPTNLQVSDSGYDYQWAAEVIVSRAKKLIPRSP